MAVIDKAEKSKKKNKKNIADVSNLSSSSPLKISALDVTPVSLQD